MVILGVAGTAKNTGKTTATLALLGEATRRGLTPGITSVGYDGEELDNITGLPKPRIHCTEGTLVATARKCLETGTAGVDVLEELPILTALGRVVLGRIRKPGLVVLAGPGLGEGVRRVAGRMEALGCDLAIVDGALNRVVPMAEAGGVVMATGAARDIDAGAVAAEAGFIAAILGLGPPAKPPEVEAPGSLLDEEDGLSTGALVQESRSRGGPTSILMPGAVGEKGLEAFSRSLSRPAGEPPVRIGATAKPAITVVFPNPMVLLAAGNVHGVGRSLREIRLAGVQVAYLRPVPLRAFTVNPVYPAGRGGREPYQYAQVDPDELKLRVAEAVQGPVIDVVRDGSEKLYDICVGGGRSLDGR